MLTNNFTPEEQRQFKFLETKKCPRHKQYATITFPNGSPKVSNCCCNDFENDLLSEIFVIVPKIIAARL